MDEVLRLHIVALNARRLFPLDDEDRFVVDAILFADLLQVLIFMDRKCQDGVANLFGGLGLMVTDDLFNLKSDLFVAAIVNPIGIQDEDVSRTHQSDLCHVG